MKETLKAGHALRVTWSGRAHRSDTPVSQIAAWRRRQVIAQDESLGEVVDRLRPFYACRIIVTDEALAKRSVTGVYNLADPVDALHGIARAHNAVVHRITPWLLLVSAS